MQRRRPHWYTMPSPPQISPAPATACDSLSPTPVQSGLSRLNKSRLRKSNSASSASMISANLDVGVGDRPRQRPLPARGHLLAPDPTPVGAAPPSHTSHVTSSSAPGTTSRSVKPASRGEAGHDGSQILCDRPHHPRPHPSPHTQQPLSTPHGGRQMTRDARRWAPWRCAWATTLSGGAIVVVTDTASGRDASTWMSSPPSSAPSPKTTAPLTRDSL